MPRALTNQRSITRKCLRVSTLCAWNTIRRTGGSSCASRLSADAQSSTRFLDGWMPDGQLLRLAILEVLRRDAVQEQHDRVPVARERRPPAQSFIPFLI